MSTASKGAQREHAAKRLLESEGWAVTRGAGSHGCADLWCAKWVFERKTDRPEDAKDYVDVYYDAKTVLRLIQVKGNTGSPYKNFSPAERSELSALAKQTGGVAELWHWPPRKPLEIHLEPDWPSIREP